MHSAKLGNHLKRHERFFLQCSNFFRQVFPCIIFSFEIRLQDIFFLKSPIPPLKSQMVGPLDATSATSFGGVNVPVAEYVTINPTGYRLTF